ncbi:MAG TPA: TetR/AcrR family transcriptional regulator [Candidatus Binatus sp.]|uniref:TetR/AcrR family transcriptional regulator n=1 Tax=Candidatus Binatus sp. TaxID=2811406 RepID=UPI002F425B11
MPSRDRTATRRRRSAAETRSAILEAAERRLLGGGPEAIRLQEIAAAAGISHPAILHHFGSREGLVEAMVMRGIAKLQGQFLEGWPSAKEPDIEGVLDRFYEVASRRGIARMLAWLILSGQGNRTMTPGVFKPAAERMHAGRVRRALNQGRRPPELEETLFAATHLFILVLGDSLFGPSVRRAIGLGSGADMTRRYRRWLSKVVERMESRRPANS